MVRSPLQVTAKHAPPRPSQPRSPFPSPELQKPFPQGGATKNQNKHTTQHNNEVRYHRSLPFPQAESGNLVEAFFLRKSPDV